MSPPKQMCVCCMRPCNPTALGGALGAAKALSYAAAHPQQAHGSLRPKWECSVESSAKSLHPRVNHDQKLTCLLIRLTRAFIYLFFFLMAFQTNRWGTKRGANTFSLLAKLSAPNQNVYACWQTAEPVDMSAQVLPSEVDQRFRHN